eukprot:2805192-Prymnesium_polylepis.1
MVGRCRRPRPRELRVARRASRGKRCRAAPFRCAHAASCARNPPFPRTAELLPCLAQAHGESEDAMDEAGGRCAAPLEHASVAARAGRIVSDISGNVLLSGCMRFTRTARASEGSVARSEEVVTFDR